MKKISVVGLGYIGLPTAILAAQNNYTVYGFDVDQKKIDSINSGITPIQEPEIQERLNCVLNKKTFSASAQLQPSDCFIITVPTPFKAEKKADLSFVFDATKKIASKLKPGNLVLLESTVPVGTTQKITKILEQKTKLTAKKDFFVAHCPERVLPGKIFKELVENDRIIGGICAQSSEKAKCFYKKFVKGNCYISDDKTAEMVKLIENSSRDIQIALANQIAGMCAQKDMNPFEVIELANKHPRVNILQPGCGVGGHCIAVDPWFLIESFPQNTQLLKNARAINDVKPQIVIEEILHKSKQFTKKPNILVLGLTFKPDIDDMRESPALHIAKELNKIKQNFNLHICEPNIKKKHLKSIGFENLTTLEEGSLIADMVVILVKHSIFKRLTPQQLKNKVVIDPCGLQHTLNIKNCEEKYETTSCPKRNGKTVRSTNSSL
jgi:UDP-N-acetyl-D-mannosaminuronic acid dehydrogenase